MEQQKNVGGIQSQLCMFTHHKNHMNALDVETGVKPLEI
jgi:hypothetical protein